VAKILADKDIKRLVGSLLIDADEKLVNPNGIELRLGKHVLFHSTGEEAELGPGLFLKVSPGETVSISSVELIDFRASSVRKVLPGSMLMGFITPTTTMMREGISQVATKIDAGFPGILNWGLRNGSTRDLILQYGEPIFKLTIFQLGEDETPETAYGDRPGDSYQDTDGIRRSSRTIPVDIPKAKLVSSSFARLDPKKQLREAGYPFDHIGTELTNLHGKFEVVSSDVRMLRDEFQRTTSDLAGKIHSETGTLVGKIEEVRRDVLKTVESLFDRKFLRVGGVIVGAIPIMYGGVTVLQGTGLHGNTISFIAMVGGVIAILASYLLTRATK
jgi:deoxycytidine triphosphate deaminase